VFSPLSHKLKSVITVVLFRAQPGNHTAGLRIYLAHHRYLQTLLVVVALVDAKSIDLEEPWLKLQSKMAQRDIEVGSDQTRQQST
jgi:hypothetical protein